MKTFVLKEEQLNKLKENIIKESYSDKVSLVKDFLDNNFMRASFEKKGDDGTIKNIGIFVQLNGKKLPTDNSMMIGDVFDMLQDKFKTILTDENERDGFLRQAIKDWYDNKITKSGNLSTYSF